MEWPNSCHFALIAIVRTFSTCSSSNPPPDNLPDDSQNPVQVATLQSKIQMLQLRMEAQKDLLRQDASAAVASLESELATAVGAHEACKQELNGAEARAAKLEKDQEEAVMAAGQH